MKKLIEVFYCDYCQSQTSDIQTINLPILQNNEITFSEKDVCNACCFKIINFLNSLKPSKASLILETPENIKSNEEKIYNINLINNKKYPPTKIFLSGLAHSKSLAISLDIIPPYILDSLAEFPLSYTKLVDDYFNWIKNNNIIYFLDSGVFSYLNNPKKEINLDDYIQRYIDFIKNYNIKNFFELDLDHMIGLEKVKEIFNILTKKTNEQPIPVWHKSRGRKEWTELCKNYDRIAIGGIASKEILPSEAKVLIPELCDEAHAYNTSVHGLGFAPLDLLNNYIMPCDSIDTTSWNKGRRQKHSVFKNGQLIIEDGTLFKTSNENNKVDLEAWINFAIYYEQIKNKKEGEEKNE